MKRYKFECPDDVRDFIEEMVSEDVIFHLDDDPEEIFEGELGLILKLNWLDMWKYCNPWELLDFYPETEKKYMDRDGEQV
jgi:hypothetical protein